MGENDTVSNGVSSGSAVGGSTAGVKKKRRKRGGSSNSGGGTKDPTTPPANNLSKKISSTSTTENAKVSNGGGRGGAKGNAKKRRGGGGRGGGGAGEALSSSRFGRSHASPLQLPHVKVTLRKIGNVNKHGSIEGLVESLRLFLDGAFPLPTAGNGAEGDMPEPFLTAWQIEKENFDISKSMFALVSSSSSSGNTSGGCVSNSSNKAFFSGWVYDEKPCRLPLERQALLPTVKDVAEDALNNILSTTISKSNHSYAYRKGGPNINGVIDSAMSHMIRECGKKYLDFVGGRIILEEESVIAVALCERVQSERKKIAADKSIENNQTDELMHHGSGNGDKNHEHSTLEGTVRNLKNLSTSQDKCSKQPSARPSPNSSSSSTSTSLTAATPVNVVVTKPAVRVRILSITPAKKSKRRGEIGGTVTLALYPPDPCLLFKESCREVGRLAAEKYLESTEQKGFGNRRKGEDFGRAVDSSESDARKIIGDSTDTATEIADMKDLKPKSLSTNRRSIPSIPNFPTLSPAERSRAVARSRILLHRTIEAMKVYSQSKHSRANNANSWTVTESPSQKTWRNRPHPMVGALVAGGSLRQILTDQISGGTCGPSCANGRKGRRGGGGPSGDARIDRYDSTIESSEDYKLFLEQWNKDGLIPPTVAGTTIAKANSLEKSSTTGSVVSRDGQSSVSYASIVASKKEDTPVVDEGGRPVAAIVIHLRAKHAEAAKAKAEAAARARASAATAASASKKKKKKTEIASSLPVSAPKKKKEASKGKKVSSTSKNEDSSVVNSKKKSKKPKASLRPTSGSKGSVTSGGPPPGAVLLKKGNGAGGSGAGANGMK